MLKGVKKKVKVGFPQILLKFQLMEIYIYIAEVARQLNKPAPTILWRLKSKNPKFDNYKYVEETPMPPSQP